MRNINLEAALETFGSCGSCAIGEPSLAPPHPRLIRTPTSQRADTRWRERWGQTYVPRLGSGQGWHMCSPLHRRGASPAAEGDVYGLALTQDGMPAPIPPPPSKRKKRTAWIRACGGAESDGTGESESPLCLHSGRQNLGELGGGRVSYSWLPPGKPQMQLSFSASGWGLGTQPPPTSGEQDLGLDFPRDLLLLPRSRRWRSKPRSMGQMQGWGKASPP